MFRKKCNCKSYNWELWVDNEDIVYDPLSKKDVCIDKCISSIIQELWKNNICTLSSCCWHNKTCPHIVCSSPDDALQAKDILKKLDKWVYWEISYWWRVII